MTGPRGRFIGVGADGYDNSARQALTYEISDVTILHIRSVTSSSASLSMTHTLLGGRQLTPTTACLTASRKIGKT
jgi:hypothetical protein